MILATIARHIRRAFGRRDCELVALGCLSCHAVMPLEESGVLYREPESERPQDASSAGVTVH